MKRFFYKTKKSVSARERKSEVIFVIVVGLILGTVFTFGSFYWYSPVTKSEARNIRATFSSYKMSGQKDNVQQIIIRFKDHEQLDIDVYCLDDEIIDKVKEIKPGSILNLYAHPNSKCILEMVYNGEVIIDFDKAVDQLSTRITHFVPCGILMYLFAAYGIAKIVRNEVYSPPSLFSLYIKNSIS